MAKMEQEKCLINGMDEITYSWVVEIDDQVSKMGSIPEREPQTSEKKAIYRRPVNVREEQDPFLYAPRIVSFGPYHHGNISCKQANEYKKRLLVGYLKRVGKKLINYFGALNEIVQDLKDAYDGLDPRWQQDDHAFLQLIIYDGCFFLEILHKVESSDMHEVESSDATNHLRLMVRNISRVADGMPAMEQEQRLPFPRSIL